MRKGGHYLETPQACTCDLNVWISTVLELIGHFLFKGGTSVGPPCMVMTTYHHIFPDTRNKNMYDLWVGISTVFKILEYFRFKGEGTIPYDHDQHTIKSSMT
jgi:hypothetical protein